MKPPRFPSEETRTSQARASDPSGSAWVSANAGSGKTHVLTRRVLRLLLSGAEPSQILCLTYTKAAAANMSNRVFAELARWTVLDDQGLASAISEPDEAPPGTDKLRAARQLFARALETPGGLKIQTIHAFCEALLHRFPLEANIAGHFEMLDGEMEAALVSEARRDLLSGAGGGQEQMLAEAFARVLGQGGEAGLDALLKEIVAKRSALAGFLAQFRDDQLLPALRTAHGIGSQETPEQIASEAWADIGISQADFERIADIAVKGNVAKYFVSSFRLALAEADPEKKLEMAAEALLTAKGMPRAATDNFVSKDILAKMPGLQALLLTAGEHVATAMDRIAILSMLDDSHAALVLARRLTGRYEALKTARGFLDFNDLIERTALLLGRSDAAQWVQYKLDRGISHILVDEAQDTSPRQWDVINGLTSEFFAGEGGRGNQARTVFAVGDEKQSIYSFQGADPKSFAIQREGYAGRAKGAQAAFSTVELKQSFRSTADILGAVDAVFASEELRYSLTLAGDPVEHKEVRTGEPGVVEVWPAPKAETTDEPEDWTVPVDHAAAPAVVLANAIAAQIAVWIEKGERLEGTGKPVSAGDIVVLVRKRDRFIHALSRALKEKRLTIGGKQARIEVAGVDRLNLAAHIAVKDMIALGRVMLQPHDDLSLAALLRSPVFGMDEEALFALAGQRPKGVSLMQALVQKAKADPSLARAAETLAGWRALSRQVPVFEFYAALMSRDGLRRRLTARLGADAGDILDEFLRFALACERSRITGLEAFLATLESASPEVKREMDQSRDEVRIMTVHAAKGLEAPIVFLVDSGGADAHAGHLPRLVAFTSAQNWKGPGFVWRAGGKDGNTVLEKATGELTKSARDEYRRLLYVGMTRAEDRLILCGYEGKNPPKTPTWRRIADEALTRSTLTIRGPLPWLEGERLVFRSTSAPRKMPDAPEKPSSEIPAGLQGIAKILAEPLPPEPEYPRPLSPSGISLVIEPEIATPTPSPVFGNVSEPSLAVTKGIAVHRLLQMLPGLARADRDAAAMRYLDAIASVWPPQLRSEVMDQALAVLDDQRFAAVFAPGSRAEVSVMGNVMVKDAPRLVSGKIDRLVISPESILIADFKTGRPPSGDVPESHAAQMALYSLVLSGLEPRRPVQAALVYVEAPRLVILPQERLDAALSRLGVSRM
ncbi:MAG: double-strand break repair helicase AddA [Rhizobiaceae bacterium]